MCFFYRWVDWGVEGFRLNSKCVVDLDNIGLVIERVLFFGWWGLVSFISFVRKVVIGKLGWFKKRF